MISLTNHASSEGEQWGRYNLPRYIYCWLYHNWDDARHSNGTSGMLETTNQHQVGPKTTTELVYNFKTKNIELYINFMELTNQLSQWTGQLVLNFDPFARLKYCNLPTRKLLLPVSYNHLGMFFPIQSPSFQWRYTLVTVIYPEYSMNIQHSGSLAMIWVAIILNNQVVELLNQSNRTCFQLDVNHVIVPFSPPARWGLLDFMSVACSSSSSPLLLLLLLNRDPRRTVFSVGPQPRPSTPSVPCRTSTTTIPAQCSLPDLNHDHPRPVFPAGPQPRVSTPSVPCRTSCRKIWDK